MLIQNQKEVLENNNPINTINSEKIENQTSENGINSENLEQEKTEVENTLEDRNIFDDNKFDIKTLDNLPARVEFDILSKEGDTIYFEMGDDFWKLENGKLYQYPDFVSLRDDENSLIVFEEENSDNSKDFGTSIMNTLNTFDFSKIDDFSLKDRSEYIKASTPSINLANLILEFNL